MIRLCMIVASVAFFWVSWASAQTWIEYRPPGAGFRVEFPGTPKIVTEEEKLRSGKSLRLTAASVDIGGSTTFMAMHDAYPPGSIAGDREKLLDGARDRAVGANTLRSEKRLMIGGVPARQVVIDLPNNQGVATILFLIAGDQLVRMICVVPRGDENSPAVQRFFASFALAP